MRGKSSFADIVFALVVGAGVALFSAPSRAETGITNDTIRIGMFGPLTGPVSMYGYPINNGAYAVYKQINDQGGINGRKIEVVMEDDACDPAKARAAAKKLVDNDNVFIVHGGSCSAAAYAARSEFIRGKVPNVIMAATDDKISMPVNRYIFTTTLTGSQDGHTMLRFVKSNPAIKRLAVVRHDDDWALSRINAIREDLKAGGIDLVADEVLNRGASDATAQVLKIKEAKPDAIFIIAYPAESAVFVRDARKYTLTGTMIGSVGMMDIMDMAQRAGGADVAEGVYTNAFLKGPIDNPDMQPYADLLRKYFPDTRLQTLNFNGMSGAYAIVAALRAIGPNPSREAFIDALDKLKDVDGGPGYCRITFTPDDHQGCHDAHMWMIKDGKVIVVGPTWPGAK